VLEYWRYPFLPSASKILDGVTLSSLLDDHYYAEARALGLRRLETSASSGFIDIEGPPINDESDIILGYVISRLVLSAAENQALVNYAALSEARRAEGFLNFEENEGLVEIANLIGIITVELHGSDFDINVMDYVRAASKLREGNWKLSNRGVSKGIVTLDRTTFIRLMREVIRQHLEDIPEAPKEIKKQFEGKIGDLKSQISKTFTERIGGLENAVSEREAEAIKELGHFNILKAPPCFNLNLLDLQSGVNLPHPARFFITSFLSALNQDSEAVMRLFATAPDFKESFTRYQVEHITGKTSSEPYVPPSCDTLASTGVCPGPNSLCRLIRHPLSYYRTMTESEKENSVRLERILLATLDIEEYNEKFIKQNMDNFGDFDFSYTDNVESRKLSAAYKNDDSSKVKVVISDFIGRSKVVEIPGDERHIWIPKATLNIAEMDSNTNYECFSLTDWRVALSIEEAQNKSTQISLIVKPFEINSYENQTKKMFMVLDVVD
jgi:DNA primase large subunit